VGKSRSAVTNTLRLLQLPASIQKLVVQGRLSAGHARALLGTADRSYQESLARSAADEGWTVRTVEEAIRARAALGQAVPSANDRREPRDPTARPLALPAPALVELEALLSSFLDTRVSVSMAGKRGRMTIEFATVEDLERIYRLITEESSESHA